MTERDLVYKIFHRSEVAVLMGAGQFDGSADDLKDGYIHLSARDQVEGTLMRHFRDKTMLFLGFCPVDRLMPELRMELSRGGALFPHLYRPLQVSDISAIVSIPEEREGWRPPTLVSAG